MRAVTIEAATPAPEKDGQPEAEPAPATPPQANSAARFRRALQRGVDALFGAVTVIVGLAVLSVIPVLNLLSLGYLLQASGNVASTGRFRHGFIGLRRAAVFGRMAVGTWVAFLPVRFVSGMWRDAQLIAPESGVAQGWFLAVMGLTALTVWHAAWACLRGGRVRHFLWPAPVRFVKWLGEAGEYRRVRDAVLEYVASLRLIHYFWLGARGFAGTLAWLFVPVGVLMLASRLSPGPAVLLSLPGALLLMLVVLYLPFLQAHFAVCNRFGALFEVPAVRRHFKRAPLAFGAAFVVTILFALPLYLLKIELTPKEVAWLPSLVFVGFIFPARLLTGWAFSRARRRSAPRHWVLRWMSRLAFVPVVFLYVVFVYLNQYLSWHGALGMLEQHAFLVPAPLFSL